ncbi:unnamed protein product, partial [Prorocentrum cordatum]
VPGGDQVAAVPPRGSQRWPGPSGASSSLSPQAAPWAAVCARAGRAINSGTSSAATTFSPWAYR